MIAVANAKKTFAHKYTFGKKRMQNIERTAITAMGMLVKLMRQSAQ